MSSFRDDLFRDVPIVGILRGFEPAQLAKIVEAAITGGLTNIEITMNSSRAPECIATALSVAAGRANIGAGTVTTLPLLKDAVGAGASFVVTPGFNLEIIRGCLDERVPVFPGAVTPTEAFSAWEAGATMIKIFPADALGPAFIRALKGPFPEMKLMPTGGVDLQTLPAFRRAGADAFGIGSPIFDRGLVERGDWTALVERCRAFANACSSQLD